MKYPEIYKEIRRAECSGADALKDTFNALFDRLKDKPGQFIELAEVIIDRSCIVKDKDILTIYAEFSDMLDAHAEKHFNAPAKQTYWQKTASAIAFNERVYTKGRRK